MTSISSPSSIFISKTILIRQFIILTESYKRKRILVVMYFTILFFNTWVSTTVRTDATNPEVAGNKTVTENKKEKLDATNPSNAGLSPELIKIQTKIPSELPIIDKKPDLIHEFPPTLPRKQPKSNAMDRCEPAGISDTDEKVILESETSDALKKLAITTKVQKQMTVVPEASLDGVKDELVEVSENPIETVV